MFIKRKNTLAFVAIASLFNNAFAIPSSTASPISNESYAVGYEFARGITLIIDKTEKDFPDVIFDRELIINGLTDSILHKVPLLSEEERKSAFSNLDLLTNKDKKADPIAQQNYENGLVAQEQAKKMDGAMATSTGLLFRVIKKSNSGVKTNLNSLVTLRYTGSLVNGELFDASSERENASRFVIKDLHKGLQEGVLLMEEGDQYEFIIKPELAYKDKPQPRIPANSTLYYNVFLDRVK